MSADFAGSLRAGDEYERAGDAAEVEALAKVIRPWTRCDDGGGFDHGSERAARAVFAYLKEQGYTRRPAAPGGVPVEALRELADEWQSVYDRWIGVRYAPRVEIFRAHANRLRALLDSATTDGGESGE